MENNYKVNVFPSANNDLFSIADYWQDILEVSPTPFIDDYEKAIGFSQFVITTFST